MRRFFVLLFCLFFIINFFSQTEKPRFISLSPSITEIFFDIGAEESLVGVIFPNNYPKEASKKEIIGSFGSLNYEKIFFLKPSECLSIQGMQSREEIKRIENMNIKFTDYKVENLDDLCALIKDIGIKAKREEEALETISKIKGEIDSFPKFINKKKGIIVVGLDPVVVAGKGSFLNDVLDKCGIENVFENKNPSYFSPSIEMIIKEKPQIIIFPDGEINDKAVEKFVFQIKDFISGIKIIKVDADLIMRPSPRVVEGMKQIKSKIEKD